MTIKYSTIMNQCCMIFLFVLFMPSVVSAKTPYEVAGEKYGIPALLLYSIATKESGNGACYKNKKPYPWALNVEGKTFCYKNHETFVSSYYRFRKSGIKSIDVGFMQFNIKWNGGFLDNESDILNPKINILSGAQVLKRCMERHLKTWDAVGCYHSSTDWRAKAYAKDVRHIYTRLLISLKSKDGIEAMFASIAEHPGNV